MASGELGRRRRASRELKWVGAYSEARVRTLQVPMRGRAHALGPGCEGPSLTIGAGSRTSLPTPRSVAPVRGLRVGLSPCHSLPSTIMVKISGGPLRRPHPRCGYPSLPRLLTEILQWPQLPPCRRPLWTPFWAVWQSGRSVGVVNASNRSRRNLSDT